MVIVVLCTNPNTRARGSRNSTKCKEYRTKIGSLKETTKRILRWLNHDHMLPPLHASSQFTIYYFGHACGLWNCGLLSNAPVVRKHMDKDSTLEIWQYQPEPNNQSTWGILMKNRNVEIYEPLIKGKPKKGSRNTQLNQVWVTALHTTSARAAASISFACHYRIMASL